VQDLKIAIVGDVHDQWEQADHDALHALQVDLVLFVGDFGNESVEVVRQVSQLDLPKAIIFGNHDAWYSSTKSGRENAPYDRTIEDRLQIQLDLIGDTHVGYGKLEFPQWDLTVVGGRPFSSGGSEWTNRRFYRDRYGIHNLTESTDRIVQQIQAAQGQQIILMGHNGPAGLGDRPDSPCGKDWNPLGGDHGDRDLEAAIQQAEQLGKSILFVTFGHMHHRLRHLTAQRDRLRQTAYTTYLNAACVPRIIHSSKTNTTNRCFTLAQIKNGQLDQATIVWLNDQHQLVYEDPLFLRKI
jgi:uncharacterized protein (TIGR04168 family)